ncbi:hypothetical protein G6Z16_01870 [Clostridium perfringens]|uniref:hypothetical protein n=1 Tax=Clostridium perfringens TaxID=1502 RepID=UPI0013E3DC6C|nr:hypothetical protein [Clostridium perfringens]NGT65640.1 hypothetical protein [Clostridium perfringens]
MSRLIRSLVINGGYAYDFEILDDLVDMLKNDGYEVSLKIKKKRFRTTEVKL